MIIGYPTGVIPHVKPKRPKDKKKTQVVDAVQPILKWAGGKRKLIDPLLSRSPQEIDTYYEPFFGGGALFFALFSRRRFKRAVVNDANRELMETYRAIQSEQVHDVIALLRTYPHTREFYNHLRRVTPTQANSRVVQAARFLYLNKTSYNGLYRVNLKGEYNVPFGRYRNPTICDPEGLLKAHRALQGVELLCNDYDACVTPAKPGDFVYFDPPYLPLNETSNFTAYTVGGFPAEEHMHLADVFFRLAERGVTVLLSNSTAKLSRRLYEGARIETIQVQRSINSRGDRRGAIAELLISM